MKFYSNLTKSLLFLFLVITCLSSCKKNDIVQSFPIDKKLIKEVVNLPTSTARGLAFTSLLNPSEKFSLLIDQIDYVLSNVSLSNAQTSLLNELKQKLPANVYSSDLSVREKFMNEYGHLWVAKANSLLGKSFIRNNFTIILNPNEGTLQKNVSIPVMFAAPSKCGCSSKSDWCETNWKCVEHVIDGTCTRVADSCGTFLFYDCDGKCESELNPE